MGCLASICAAWCGLFCAPSVFLWESSSLESVQQGAASAITNYLPSGLFPYIPPHSLSSPASQSREEGRLGLPEDFNIIFWYNGKQLNEKNKARIHGKPIPPCYNKAHTHTIGNMLVNFFSCAGNITSCDINGRKQGNPPDPPSRSITFYEQQFAFTALAYCSAVPGCEARGCLEQAKENCSWKSMEIPCIFPWMNCLTSKNWGSPSFKGPHL